jgi:hypothetical protein
VCTLYGSLNFHSLCGPSISSALCPLDRAWSLSLFVGDMVEVDRYRVDEMRGWWCDAFRYDVTPRLNRTYLREMESRDSNIEKKMSFKITRYKKETLGRDEY